MRKSYLLAASSMMAMAAFSSAFAQTAPASGLFEYLDTNSPPAAAFYRTSEP